MTRNIRLALFVTLLVLVAGAVVIMNRDQPSADPIVVDVPNDHPAQGLAIYRADANAGILIGAYREGDDKISFEVTRGERVSWAIQALEGGGPYVTHGCYRNGYGQPVIVMGGCVNDDPSIDIGVSDEYAQKTMELIAKAAIALSTADLAGLEAERDFLVENANTGPITDDMDAANLR